VRSLTCLRSSEASLVADAAPRAAPAHHASGADPQALYTAVAARVEEALLELHAQLHAPQEAPASAAPQQPPPASAPLPARVPLASRLYEWATNSPASRELGRHLSPAGFAAADAWRTPQMAG
jgi:hypothetical protein